MERRLKTPIRRTVPVYVPRTPLPYLELQSALDDNDKALTHRMRVVLSRGTYGHDDPTMPQLRMAERAVRIGRQPVWLPRTVRAVITPDMNGTQPDRLVLRAFGHIESVDHDIALDPLSYRRTEKMYTARVGRGNVAFEVPNEQGEPVRCQVGKAELAAAGLRLALATALIETTHSGDQTA